MNEPSPLVPQGSFESQARRKSHVKIAVFSILAVHVVVLGGLLILGCKRDDKSAGTDTAGTPPPMTNDLGTPPPFGSDVVTTGAPEPAPTAPVAGTTTTPTTPTTPTAPLTPPVTVPPTGTAPIEAGAMTEHKIAPGESFSTLATKYGVTLKAIQDANPNLVPTKLQIGTVVKIPPKAVVAPRPAATADTADTYTVKSGDTLGKIADLHKTTVKELQRLNNLATTQIKVGQKLKLPPRTAPAGTIPPAQ
jgi:LysM repeat protein